MKAYANIIQREAFKLSNPRSLSVQLYINYSFTNILRKYTTQCSVKPASLQNARIVTTVNCQLNTQVINNLSYVNKWSADHEHRIIVNLKHLSIQIMICNNMNVFWALFI